MKQSFCSASTIECLIAIWIVFSCSQIDYQLKWKCNGLSVNQTWKYHIIKFAQQFVGWITKTMSKQLFDGFVSQSQTFCIPFKGNFNSNDLLVSSHPKWDIFLPISLLIFHWPFCLLTSFHWTNSWKRWNFLSNYLISATGKNHLLSKHYRIFTFASLLVGFFSLNRR